MRVSGPPNQGQVSLAARQPPQWEGREGCGSCPTCGLTYPSAACPKLKNMQLVCNRYMHGPPDILRKLPSLLRGEIAGGVLGSAWWSWCFVYFWLWQAAWPLPAAIHPPGFAPREVKCVGHGPSRRNAALSPLAADPWHLSELQEVASPPLLLFLCATRAPAPIPVHARRASRFQSVCGPGISEIVV